MEPLDTAAAPQELLAQRGQVLAWLERLDQVAHDAPPHIVERIRRDYQDRLERLTRALAAHRDALEAQLQEAEARWRATEERLQQARDAREELRLRHLLGEISDAEWNERRDGLEESIAATEREHAELGQEVERLRALVADIGEPSTAGAQASAPPPPRTAPPPPESPGIAAPPAAEPATTAAAAAPTHDEAADDELAFLRNLPDSEPTPAPASDAWDDSFLRELDQVLATSGAASRPESKTLRCKECGALNDPRAWYCEICGADLT